MDREMVVVSAGGAVLIEAIYLFVYFVAFRPMAGESTGETQLSMRPRTPIRRA